MSFNIKIYIYIYVLCMYIYIHVNIYVHIHVYIHLNPPAPEVQGAWSSGWHKSTKVQVYLGGGPFIWKKPPVFDRSWRSPSQNTVKNRTERTCSLPRPPNLGQKKSEKTPRFSIYWIHFLGLQRVFFYSLMWGGPEAFFVILDRFWTHFRIFFKPETMVFTVCLSFVEVWRLSSKMLRPS